MKTDYFSSYTRTLDSLIAQHGESRAMELIVGGQYETIGILEASLLRTLGLQPGHTVVDIGCGTGRLAWALRDYLQGKYIGFDIVPQLLPMPPRVSVVPTGTSFRSTSPSPRLRRTPVT
jgi:predicted TPR repeat methyltransferase